MSINRLPRVVEGVGDPPAPLDPSHPMRTVTREVALGTGWTPEMAEQVRILFDTLAPTWNEGRNTPGRMAVVEDALKRGGPFGRGVAIELGAGTGIATPLIAAHLPDVIAIDLSEEMLRQAPPSVPRLIADGSMLPFADGAVETMVLVNMFLFPREADRVLSPDGAIVWVNTVGPQTPIYLSDEEVQSSLGEGWDLVSSEAAWGTWSVARRRPAG